MKRTAKGADSKARLIEAAIELIAENGYRDTKISDIVKAAGLTQAAFYLYFPSKEAIFRHILETFHQTLEKHLHPPAIPTRTDEDVLGRMQQNFEALFALFQEQPKLSKIFLTEERGIDDVEKLIHQTISDNLQRNQAAGLIRQDASPGLMANCMIGMFIQVAVKEILDTGRRPGDVAREFAAILLHGLASGRPEMRGSG